MRCPSLRWAAGQGPVLVGTIGSLWTSCDAGEGAGLLDTRDAEAKGTPGKRGYHGLSWGKWTLGEGQGHKRQIQRSSSNQDP